jgi:aminopeptidase N
MRFSGSVTIRGKKVGRPSKRITLHAKGLKVTSATVIKHDKKGDQPVEVERINLQKGYDEVRIHAKAMVYPGEYTITLEFAAPITKGMTGLYPCFYKHDGKEKTMLMTQFESHHARECFPCIDEPEAKATYKLSLVTPKEEVVLSNTPIESEEEVDSSQLIVDRKLQTTNYKLTTF